ncbi:hypothetical protein Pcinc_012326 [Petrolisthes cinctipes]|uniref:Uncharacterized protein n=1 Tax=Petrolisthes cinctipes TaxID=88211 RepID=A0AAE1FZ39_PETCI|nr:hypothetical protein Pcinc_012326 [Petrolisthes cinctipes]
MNHHDTQLTRRASIIALHEEGYSSRRIAERLGCSRSCIQKWIHRWQETGNLNDLKRNPRSRVTSREDDQRILQAAQDDPVNNAKAIREELALAVSATTIRGGFSWMEHVTCKNVGEVMAGSRACASLPRLSDNEPSPSVFTDVLT